MDIKVLGFGIAKDIFKGSSTTISLAAPYTVFNLKVALEKQFKQLADLSSYMIAVNSTYASDAQEINDSDEIALIPPVSGG